MHKLLRDLDHTEDEIDKVGIKDLYKLVSDRRKNAAKGKRRYNTLG